MTIMRPSAPNMAKPRGAGPCTSTASPVSSARDRTETSLQLPRSAWLSGGGATLGMAASSCLLQRVDHRPSPHAYAGPGGLALRAGPQSILLVRCRSAVEVDHLRAVAAGAEPSVSADAGRQGRQVLH